MLTHVVIFKFGDLDQAAEARDRLLAMNGRIPALKGIEAGVDITRSERCWDLALLTRFDDEAGLAAYATDPIHLEVVAYIKSVARGSKVVDFHS
jgi:hypothetical protein